jgi:hypothetical protein
LLLLTTILVIPFTPVDVMAQPAIYAAVGVHHQGKGSSDDPYLAPPFGGNAGALVAGAEHEWYRNLTVGLEVSVAGGVSGKQSQRAPGGNNVFTSDHRDSMLSVLLKPRIGRRGGPSAALAAGGGIGLRRTVRDGMFIRFFGAPSTSFHDTLTSVVLQGTLGGDVVLPITSHLGVLALGRVHMLADNDRLGDGVVERGVSSLIVRGGIGAVVSF